MTQITQLGDHSDHSDDSAGGSTQITQMLKLSDTLKTDTCNLVKARSLDTWHLGSWIPGTWIRGITQLNDHSDHSDPSAGGIIQITQVLKLSSQISAGGRFQTLDPQLSVL